MSKRGLLIVARNLGDAVITSGFLSRLISIPDVTWTVLCRPEVAFLFEGQPGIETVLRHRFPMGTDKKLTAREALRLFGSVLALRGKRIDVSVDLLGDFREVGMARLINSRRHFSPVWPEDHLFRKLIRASPARWIPDPCHVSRESGNIYVAYDEIVGRIVSELGGGGGHSPPHTTGGSAGGAEEIRVGFHPFASQDCKLWGQQNWHALAAQLQARNVKVVAFGGTHEKDRLKDLFRGALADDAFICVPLSAFFEEIKTLDLLVGLDSLSVHAAHRVGTPSVMLIGANDPGLWAPPSCLPVTSTARCGNQPCFNVPNCQRTEFEFDCMKQLSVSAALQAVLNGLAGKVLISDTELGLAKSG